MVPFVRKLLRIRMLDIKRTLLRAVRRKVLNMLIYLHRTVNLFNNTNLGGSWHEKPHLPANRESGKLEENELELFQF